MATGIKKNKNEELTEKNKKWKGEMEKNYQKRSKRP